MDAIGLHGEDLDVVLMQMVNLMRDGQPVRMSKRTGNAITLTDLLEEVWFLYEKSVDCLSNRYNYRH